MRCRAKRRLRAPLVAVVLVLAVCVAQASSLPPVQPVARVDVPRFIGKWYLIGAIPTANGKHAFNAVQTYTLQPGGGIRTTFSIHEDASTARTDRSHPRPTSRPAPVTPCGA